MHVYRISTVSIHVARLSMVSWIDIACYADSYRLLLVME